MLVDEAGPSGLVGLDLAAVLVEAKARRLLGVEGRGGKVEAYDEQTRAPSAIQEREERIQRAITRGYDDLVNGRVRPWKRAKADADRIRAARHEIG